MLYNGKIGLYRRGSFVQLLFASRRSNECIHMAVVKNSVGRQDVVVVVRTSECTSIKWPTATLWLKLLSLYTICRRYVVEIRDEVSLIQVSHDSRPSCLY